MPTQHISKSVLKNTALFTLLLFGLTACGGGSGSGDDTDTTDDTTTEESTDTTGDTTTEGSEGDSNTNADVLTGIFGDSPVEGLSYSTETQSGVTNSAGEFRYLIGETITFSIGDLALPVVTGAEIITPIEMSLGERSTAINIARLLQSIDEDGNPDNGISIPDRAASSATAINFSVSENEFETNAEVINLVANASTVNNALISSQDAIEHLESTLGSDALDALSTNNTSTDTVVPNGENSFTIDMYGNFYNPATGVGTFIESTLTVQATSKIRFSENTVFPEDSSCFTLTPNTTENVTIGDMVYIEIQSKSEFSFSAGLEAMKFDAFQFSGFGDNYGANFFPERDGILETICVFGAASEGFSLSGVTFDASFNGVNATLHMDRRF